MAGKEVRLNSLCALDGSPLLVLTHTSCIEAKIDVVRGGGGGGDSFVPGDGASELSINNIQATSMGKKTPHNLNLKV